MRFRVILAPTTSWWWKCTPSDRSTASAACRCRGRAPPAENLVGARLLDDGDRVGEDVLVPLDRVLFERQRQAARGGTRPPSPVLTRNQRPAVGSGSTISLSSSSRIRSLETISSRDRIASTAADERRRRGQAVTGDEPGRPEHAQWIVREGHLGIERGAQAAGGEVRRCRRTDRSARGRAG